MKKWASIISFRKAYHPFILIVTRLMIVESDCFTYITILNSSPSRAAKKMHILTVQKNPCIPHRLSLIDTSHRTSSPWLDV